MSLSVHEVSQVSSPYTAQDDLLGELEIAYRSRVRADLRLMEVIRRADREQTYLDHGHEDLVPWLSAMLRIGYRTAESLAEVALALGRLPRMSAAYAGGDLSYDHLRALVQVASPENEEALVLECRKMSVGQTFALVQKIKGVSRDEAAETRSTRYLTKEWDYSERVLHLYARLPDEQGVRVERAIDRIASQLPRSGPDGAPLSLHARRADALEILADAKLTSDTSQPHIVVHVDADELAKEGVANLEDGPNIAAETARRLMCDSLAQMVLRRGGKPIGVGRARRTVTPRMRHELKLRDSHCRFPGCNRRMGLHAHHITPWAAGGPTDLENLILVCPFHHTFVHESGWRVVGAGADARFLPSASARKTVRDEQYVVSDRHRQQE